MTQSETGQIGNDAARIYDEFFLPALFEQWPPHLLNAARVGEGHTVLDVGCGTGVVARAAERTVGSPHLVTGVDINEGMLALARERSPLITYRLAPAESLPFEDASFDAVLCQFALMFFEDRAKALREMWRVVRTGGRVTVAVWGRLEASPGYAAMVGLLEEMFGVGVADGLRAPFVLGELDDLRAVFERGGLPVEQLQTIEGRAIFPSIESWVYTDIRGWTMSDAIDEAGFQRLVQQAQAELKEFQKPDGQVEFAAPAHLVTVFKD